MPLAERLRTLEHLVPPLVVFGIVMGSLYFGIATATESAALGVVVGAVLRLAAAGQAELASCCSTASADGRAPAA